MESPNDGEPASAYTSKTFGREYSFEVKKSVGAMSISPCGRDVVLASRQGLHVIDLDSPYRQPRHLPHYTPWEVADVQWSPFPARDYWVVSTSNQKALVWNLMMSDARSAVEHYLHAHTRAITDINFSAYNPDILATCAVDSFVHCWDLRHPSKPALSFADWFAGATQVKWNRQDCHIIASSHDRFLRIWDDRNGAHPLHSIEAHDTKIYGLDWNRVRTSALVTCSLDKTIKFWDYSVDLSEPERVIETSFPIWRARHTPFGYGVLAMPQRDDHDVYLYKRRADSPEQDISSPVTSFQGHDGQVKEFLWRCRGNVDESGTDHREFQLVTWGTDKKLRLHPIDETTLAAVGYTKGTKSDSKLHLTRTNAIYKTFRDCPTKAVLGPVKSSSSLHQQLQEPLILETAKSGMTLRGKSAYIMGGFLNSKVSGQSKDTHKNDMNPISWMKGVKAGKKDVTSDHGPTLNAMTDHRMHRGSDEFETLGEEIVHVGTKFSKVKFEKAEDKQRYIKFGMRGIWENNGSSTYLECRIEFPEGYPFGSTPHLTIEKTARVDHDVLSRLETDVQAIGDAYLKFKRNSLEAIVRYLHGDQSLDDALNWIKQDIDTSAAEFQTVDESSSDEDDIGIANRDHETEFGLAGSGYLESTSINAHMPLAKPCAGIWAQNGILVCFFPPKIETSPLGTSLGFSRPDGLFKAERKRMGGDPGKVNASHARRSTTQSMTSSDHYDSTSDSDSSESDQSSSASSTSFREPLIKDVAIFAQQIYQGDNFDPSTYTTDRVFDSTLKSAGSESVLNSRGPKNKSILTLHDFNDLLPPKENLAKDYILSGPGACKHNSDIAQRYGFSDLGEVWRILDLVLQYESSKRGLIDLKQRNHGGRAGSKGGGLRHTKIQSSTPRKDSGYVSGFLNWSNHPFGQQMLIERLFDFYARTADIQMLAMMSSILAEHDKMASMARLGSETSLQKYKTSPAVRKLHNQEYFSAFKNPSSISPENRSTKTRTSSLRSSAKSRNDYNSLSSSLGVVVNGNGSLEALVTETPQNRSFEERISTSKLSTSPEWIRPLQKSSTSLANAIITSIPRPFSLTTSAASSPPPTTSFIKKKISPIGSLIVKGSTWSVGSSNISDSTVSPANSTKNSETRARSSHNLPSITGPKVMTVSLKDEDKFETPRGPAQHLLDPTKASLYQIWQEQYAELLYNWNLLITRAELLKFNGGSELAGPEIKHRSSSLTLEIEDMANTVRTSIQGVIPSSHCQSCGTIKTYQDTSLTCQICDRTQTTLCVLCNLPIAGRSSPCLVCGHILHIGCRKSWQKLSTIPACPTGCGCICTLPSLPPNGIITPFTEVMPAFISPTSSRFAFTHQINRHSRRSSAATSISTIRGFGKQSSHDRNGSFSSEINQSTQSSTGAQISQQYQGSIKDLPIPQVAYASLQSLAAQSRPSGNAATGAQNSSTYSSDRDTANTRIAKLRQSKSLLAIAGVGVGTNNSSNGSNSSAGTQGERRRNNSNNKIGQFSSRRGSGASTRTSTSMLAAAAAGGSRVARQNSARNDEEGALGNNNTNRNVSAAGKQQRQMFQQQGGIAFELGFDDEDDSDIDGDGVF